MEEKTLESTEEILTAIYIQQSRMYDVLLLLLGLQSQELVETIMNKHAVGELLSPPPALKGTDEQE
jgi:hypothetical protein